MSKEIYELSTTAAQNNFSPSDGGFPEQMLRSDVNNAAREHLAAMRRYYNAPEWIRVRYQGPLVGDVGVFTRVSANQFTITLAGVDLSGYFTDKRIILIKNGTSPGVDLVTQCNGNATYLANVTTVNTVAPMAVGATDAYSYFTSILRKQALLEDRTDFYIPATADSAGIQASIDAASAAGSGIVLLTQPSYSITTQLDINAGKGNITILGAGRQTTLLRGANINSIIAFDNNAESLTLMNLRFDGNFVTFAGGNGYGLNIANCLSVSVLNCEFDRCNHAINISGSACRQISIAESSFKYYRYGVVTNSVTDTHEGEISGCVFDGTLLSGATPAAVKLSGSWRVVGNRLRNFGTAASNPIGIWIWDKTAPGNGGFNCVVNGNDISTAQVTGTGIWMGGDDGVCTGNVITTGSSGIGILVGGITAGNPAERIEVVGNSIRQGSRGITVLENCRHSVVANNSIRPTSGTCIDVSGDANVVTGNVCHQAATIGIDILGTAANNIIKLNQILDVLTTGIIVRANADTNEVSHNKIAATPATAITVELNAATTRVFENWAPSHAAPLNNLSASTRYARNRTADLVVYASASAVNVNDTVNNVTVIASQALPADGGIGRYRIRFILTANVGANITFDLRVGPAGSPTTDTSVYTNTVAASSTETSAIGTEAFFTVSDALWTRWSLGAIRGPGVLTTVDAEIQITKISDPLS